MGQYGGLFFRWPLVVCVFFIILFRDPVVILIYPLLQDLADYVINV